MCDSSKPAKANQTAIDDKALIRAALAARQFAWAPYSGFMVGAAVQTTGGKIYTGCNIENAAYSPTNCGERTAIFKAVSEGEREFSAIAIVGGPRDCNQLAYAYPCGVCRQVMMEFCSPKDFRIIVAATEEDYNVHSLEALLPNGFGPANLQHTD